jgi:hypothetical protein
MQQQQQASLQMHQELPRALQQLQLARQLMQVHLLLLAMTGLVLTVVVLVLAAAAVQQLWCCVSAGFTRGQVTRCTTLRRD